MPEQDTKNPPLSPVLLRVSPSWKPPEGLEIKNRYGDYVEGSASAEALNRIARDPEVLTHEVDLSAGRVF